jgi:DNA-binding NarL/FixJ family response regulator
MTEQLYSEIKIIIADDHEIFRNGFIAALESEKKLNVIDQVANGIELIESVSKHSPDIVILDIQMPKMDGIEATIILRNKYPLLGILALTFKEDDDSIMDMIKAGANGYLVKSVSKQEIIEGIVTAYHGSNYYCRNIQSRFIDLLKLKKIDRYNLIKKTEFTPREIEIIGLVRKEHSAKTIANELGITKKTVENMKAKIYIKMKVHNTAGVINYALKHKLIN